MYDDQIRAWVKKQEADRQVKVLERGRQTQMHHQAMQELLHDPRWNVYAQQLREWRDQYQDQVSQYTHALTGQRVLSPEQYSQLKRDSAYAQGSCDAFERAWRFVMDHVEGGIEDATQQGISGPELYTWERHEETPDPYQNRASGEAEPGGWAQGGPARE